jgi:hypothetical protein
MAKFIKWYIDGVHRFNQTNIDGVDRFNLTNFLAKKRNNTLQVILLPLYWLTVGDRSHTVLKVIDRYFVFKH